MSIRSRGQKDTPNRDRHAVWTGAYGEASSGNADVMRIHRRAVRQPVNRIISGWRTGASRVCVLGWRLTCSWNPHTASGRLQRDAARPFEHSGRRIGPGRPSCREMTIRVDPSMGQRKGYERIELDFAVWVEGLGRFAL